MWRARSERGCLALVGRIGALVDVAEFQVLAGCRRVSSEERRVNRHHGPDGIFGTLTQCRAQRRRLCVQQHRPWSSCLGLHASQRAQMSAYLNWDSTGHQESVCWNQSRQTWEDYWKTIHRRRRRDGTQWWKRWRRQRAQKART